MLVNKQGQPPELQAYTIEVTHDMQTGEELFHAKTVNTIKHPTGELITTIRNETKSPDKADIYAFMDVYGVAESEINKAFHGFEENGHNAAKFGWGKTFMWSEFTGTVQ